MLGPLGSAVLRSGRAPEPEETQQRPVRGALSAAIAAAEPAAAAALAVSQYSAVKRYSGKANPTLHDAPALKSAGRIGSRAATRYHLVAVTPLDLGADRPRSVEIQKGDHVILADLSLSLPLGQRPYLGRAHPLGHHDRVVAHVGGIGHGARLRPIERFGSRRHAPRTQS
jgi:hypothetical protein